MKHQLFHWSLVLTLLLLISSCSNSKTEGVLKCVPADADVVVVGNVKTIIESAGGSIENNKLKLPSAISDLLSESEAEKLDELNDILKNGGINPDVIAMVMSKFKDNRPIIIFALEDSKKFVKKIEDNGFKEKDDDEGITLYTKKTYESSYDSSYDDYSYIGIKGNYGYMVQNVWVGSDYKPMKAIKRLVEDAKEKDFASTVYGKYILEGNAGGAAVRIPSEMKRQLKDEGIPSSMAGYLEGTVCFKFDLSGDKAEAIVKVYDEDGKVKDLSDAKKLMDIKAKISQNVLEYLGKDESLVYAVSLKDVKWDNIFDMYTESFRLDRSTRSALSMASSYLEKIDGTAAIGIGLTDGLESVVALSQERDILNNLAMTLVVETKSGKAKGILNDIEGFLESNVPLEHKGSGFIMEYPGVGTLYAEATDNVLVFSTHPIKKSSTNQTVKNVKFGSTLCAMGLYLGKDNKLMKDVALNYDVTASILSNINDGEGIMTLEIKGGSGGVLAKLINIVKDIEEQSDKIQERFHAGYNPYGYSGGWDDIEVEEVEEVAVDSVAVEEDWEW